MYFKINSLLLLPLLAKIEKNVLFLVENLFHFEPCHASGRCHLNLRLVHLWLGSVNISKFFYYCLLCSSARRQMMIVRQVTKIEL